MTAARPTDAQIADAILTLAAARAPASLCPSEAARVIAKDGRWRALMARVREVAAQLAGEGLLVATQRGRAVDPLAARGPIRLSQPPYGEAASDGDGSSASVRPSRR
ncbi:DUF3253 domain-containing protein [Acuticoccus sp.]|uniref:DUF3253 domain-containing protein n=1 Tax=Acuticoccus sp. TaxID=1904378 RepID=UPI003B525BBE